MLLRRQVGGSEETDHHIDMTPMVDVVFQLMTFMLFAMRVTTAQGVVIPEAKNGAGVSENEAIVLTLAPDPAKADAPALILVGEGDKTATIRPEEVQGAIREGKAQGLTKVVIQADGDVKYQDVLGLAASVGEAGDVTIHLGVQERE